ncbi:MAG: undecaprenyl-diphosphatase UppP, partial [Candidatus Omnitrophica bacterium]|nr:undecaprenyl-diphosphatase UppP [Candidatus Omnitrophota bacterium]
MPISHAVILGIIQGLTEVLPISSSAHLVIVPWFSGWQYQGLSFDVALHLGTALALGIYFFKDWIDIFKARHNMLWYIIVGTIPGALAGLLLEEKAETVFRSPVVIMTALAVFAVILWIADHAGKKDKAMDKIGLKESLAIGLAQAIAIIPGVSRSGITITAGLFGGFSREAAARFSFLLATPIVFAAAALKLPKLHAADLNAAFWAGVITSAASGFAAIHFLLKFVRKSSLNIFVFYRIIFAIVVL